MYDSDLRELNKTLGVLYTLVDKLTQTIPDAQPSTSATAAPASEQGRTVQVMAKTLRVFKVLMLRFADHLSMETTLLSDEAVRLRDQQRASEEKVQSYRSQIQLLLAQLQQQQAQIQQQQAQLQELQQQSQPVPATTMYDPMHDEEMSHLHATLERERAERRRVETQEQAERQRLKDELAQTRLRADRLAEETERLRRQLVPHIAMSENDDTHRRS